MESGLVADEDEAPEYICTRGWVDGNVAEYFALLAVSLPYSCSPCGESLLQL